MVSPVKTNAYNMFKMPDTVIKNCAVNMQIEPDSVNLTDKKKSKVKKITAFVIAAAAITGCIYAFKTGKLKALRNRVLNLFHKAPKVDAKQTENAAGAFQEGLHHAANAAGAAAGDLADKAAGKAGKGNGDGNFVVAAFGVGLIAKTFKDAKNSEDDKIAELKKLVLEKEKFIRDEEIPMVTAESKTLAEEYNENTVPALRAMSESVGMMRDKAAAFAKLGVRLNVFFKDKDFSVNFVNSDVKEYDVKLISPDRFVITKYDRDGNKLFDGKFVNQVLTQLDAYEPSKGDKISVRAKFSESKLYGFDYMSHYIKYNPKNGKLIGVILFDDLDNEKLLYSADKDGKMKKLTKFDSMTLDLDSIWLPGKDGSKWEKKYGYHGHDWLKSAELPASCDMPKRIYNFDGGKAQSLDMFDEEGKKLALNVPFEKD